MPPSLSGLKWKTTQRFISGQPRRQDAELCYPGRIYVVRPKAWRPSHPVFIVDGGMQIATSSFHTYIHNLITEARVLF